MILCDKNAFVLAMDLKAEGGGEHEVASVYLFVIISAVTTEHRCKDRLCFRSGNWNNYNWTKI